MFPISRVEPSTEKRTRYNDEKKEGENKKKKKNGALLIKRRPHPRHERPNSPLEHKSPDFSTAAR